VNYKSLHKWQVSLEEARKIQLQLREQIVLKRDFGEIHSIGGADVSYRREEMCGVVTVFKFPSLEQIEAVKAIMKPPFPYIPGFLTFREGPCLLRAFKNLRTEIDLIIFDGAGIAHPTSLGLATHLGILLDKPTIGCTKSHLVGEFKEPEDKKGAKTPLYFDGKVVGVVLRTKEGAKPLFVSPGFKIDLESSISFILRCCSLHRLPEPLRAAHLLSKKFTN
jgi:deoxyribonuclease V